MLMLATPTPQRVARDFQRMTLLAIQVLTAAQTLHIGTEQGEVTSPGATSDGIQLDQQNTGIGATAAGPFYVWWKGELWYSASVNTSWVLLVLGEADPPRLDSEVFGNAVAKALDKIQKSGQPSGVKDAKK